jgi:hypothetical protein
MSSRVEEDIHRTPRGVLGTGHTWQPHNPELGWPGRSDEGFDEPDEPDYFSDEEGIIDEFTDLGREFRLPAAAVVALRANSRLENPNTSIPPLPTTFSSPIANVSPLDAALVSDV